MRVWVANWEMQCCGAPFAAGEEVEWGLLAGDDVREWLAEPLGAVVAASITHCEAHHQADDDPQPSLRRGRVESIHAAYWRLAPRPGENPQFMHPVADTGVLEQRERVDGWEPERDGGPSFQGYIVELSPFP